MNTLKSIWSKVNEIFTAIIAGAIYFYFPVIGQKFGFAIGTVGIGMFHDLIFTAVALFFYNSIAWLLLWLVFPGLYQMKDNLFRRIVYFNSINRSSWQKAILLLSVYFVLLFSLVLLHTRITGLV